MYHVLQQHVTRRRLIATGTAVALGATGLALGSENARAQASITMGELAIPDATFAPADNQAHAIWATVHGQYQWSNLQADPGKWQVYLLVGDGSDSWSAVGIAEGQASRGNESGTFSVRGDLTAASAYSSEDFQPNGDGTPKTLNIPVAVMLVVRDGSGNVLTDAQASRTVAVEIKPGGAVVSVGAAGELVMQDDSDSPTPTVSG